VRDTTRPRQSTGEYNWPDAYTTSG
jgi:hypothetical protein